MTRLNRAIALVAGCGLMVAGVAVAGIPDPTNFECRNLGAQSLGISCPASIYVVGEDGAGVVDPVGEFCVYARDFNNQPIVNSVIAIDFSHCDVQLCADQRDPAVVVDCPNRILRKVTGIDGVACFRVLGKSLGVDCAPATNCAAIYSDGFFVCSLSAPTFDLVSQGGEDGLNPNDLAAWLYLSGNCVEGPYRGDYDCSNQGLLDANDLAVWLFVSGQGGSALNCAGAKSPIGPKCP